MEPELDEKQPRGWNAPADVLKAAQEARGLGDVLAKAGNYDEAEVCLRRALVLNPQDAVAHMILATVHVERRQLDEALVRIDLALALQRDLNGAAQYRQRIESERDFLKATEAFLEFVRSERRAQIVDDTTQIVLPSTVVDDSGQSRYGISLSAAIVEVTWVRLCCFGMRSQDADMSSRFSGSSTRICCLTMSSSTRAPTGEPMRYWPRHVGRDRSPSSRSSRIRQIAGGSWIW